MSNTTHNKMSNDELLDYIESRVRAAQQVALPFAYNEVARLLELAGDPRASVYRGGAHHATLHLNDAFPLIQKARARVEFINACTDGAPLNERLLLLAKTYAPDDVLRGCILGCAELDRLG